MREHFFQELPQELTPFSQPTVAILFYFIKKTRNTDCGKIRAKYL